MNHFSTTFHFQFLKLNVGCVFSVCVCSLQACHRRVHRDVSEAGAGAGPPAARWSLRPPGVSVWHVCVCVCVCTCVFSARHKTFCHTFTPMDTEGDRSCHRKGAGVLALTFGRLRRTHGRLDEGGEEEGDTHTHTHINTHTLLLSGCSWCGRTGEGVSILCFHTDDTLVKSGLSVCWDTRQKQTHTRTHAGKKHQFT